MPRDHEKRCASCGNLHGHARPLDAAACAYRAAIRTELRALAAKRDKPPKPAQVDDLLAHLTSHYDDDHRAFIAVDLVLDLGWRPAFGDSAADLSGREAGQ